MEYTIIIERGASSFGAYVSDLPGCVAAVPVRELIREAIEFHLEGLK